MIMLQEHNQMLAHMLEMQSTLFQEWGDDDIAYELQQRSKLIIGENVESNAHCLDCNTDA